MRLARTHLLLVLAAAGCHASAQVKQTTPVASLQSYGVVGVRGAEGSIDQGLTQQLVDDTVRALASQCQFQTVLPADQLGQTRPDLLIDLNLRQATRGGTGFVQNENKANVEVLVVLSDGIDQELLGTAWIGGESAAVATNAQTPEQQAIGAVAGEIGKVLVKSGCTGPRVARMAAPAPASPTGPVAEAPPATPPAGPGTPATPGGPTPPPGVTPTTPPATPPPGETPPPPAAGDTHAQAEASNEEGKRLFVAAQLDAAVAKFREARALLPDPRYDFNICLALEAQKQYDDAIASCQAVAASATGSLAAKAKDRVAIIESLKAK